MEVDGKPSVVSRRNNRGRQRNQPADKVLARADLVLTIGYDPVEYDPSFWNVGKVR